MKKRLNIGFLIDDLTSVFSDETIKGAELGAIAIDANLFIFPGKYLDTIEISDDHFEYEYQYNTLFEYARNNDLDIIFATLGMIGCRVEQQVRLKFLEKYLGIPIVTLFTDTPGYPSILFDNVSAFKDGVCHLIEDHGAKNIGFVSGPKTNIDAIERLHAFESALSDHGMFLNEDYIVYGNFEASTEPQIAQLIVNHPELDTVVFANDLMALAGYRVCERLGIEVGRELKFLSFDNSDFSSRLNPPLSTVDANATELCYKAIIKAPYLVKEYSQSNIKVDTHLIIRGSCGCKHFESSSYASQVGVTGLCDLDHFDELMNAVNYYLFREYLRSSEISAIKNQLSVFIFRLLQTASNLESKVNMSRTVEGYHELLQGPIFRYTDIEYFMNVLKALQFELVNASDSREYTIAMMNLFIDFISDLTLYNWRASGVHQIDRMSLLVNSMTNDMFRLGSGEYIPFERALNNLSLIGIETAYLFTFTESIRREKGEDFELPDHLLFRAYYKDQSSHGIPEKEQLIDSKSIFSHSLMPEDRRVSMVFMPLFSGEEVYGVLVCETHYEHFKNIEPIGMHISITTKSLMLLDQQEKIQRDLEENLEQISENNKMLTTMSKTDTLTGLLNRRGLYDKVNALTQDPENKGRRAALIFADMDYLKMINDTYGHDDGDFALRGIANILKDAMSNEDLFPEYATISRYGGDEFVAFAFLSDTFTEEAFKAHITEVINACNETLGKPYKLSMSTGVSEFTCEEDMNLYDLLMIADRKLYEEKKAKKAKRGVLYPVWPA